MSSNDPSKPHPLEKADYERISRYRYRLRRFLRISEKLCKDQGLTPLQYQLLLHIKGFPDRDWATISELAERLQAQHNGVVALIDRCEKLGLVGRRPGRNDRRIVEIHLSTEGEAMLASVAARHRDELQMLLKAFTQMDDTSAR